MRLTGLSEWGRRGERPIVRQFNGMGKGLIFLYGGAYKDLLTGVKVSIDLTG